MGRPQSPGSPFRILWDAINEVNRLAEKHSDIEAFKAGAELTRRASEYSEKQGNNRHSDSKRYAVPEKTGASVPPNSGYTVPTRNEGKNDRKDTNEINTTQTVFTNLPEHDKHLTGFDKLLPLSKPEKSDCQKELEHKKLKRGLADVMADNKARQKAFEQSQPKLISAGDAAQMALEEDEEDGVQF